MKAGIHPDYQQTTIRCACGNVIETGSTKKDIRVEVCSKCHPFYTGKQKMVDTGGRVSRFNKKFRPGQVRLAPPKPHRGSVRLFVVFCCRPGVSSPQGGA